MNIFESQEKKKKRRRFLWFYAFYGPFLFAFAYLLALKPTAKSLCFTRWCCAQGDAPAWKKALVLYAYFVVFAWGAIYIYKGIEKLAGHKRHIRFFKWLFFLLPLLFIGFMAWKEPVWEKRHVVWAIFFALAGIAGLLLIETRPRK